MWTGDVGASDMRSRAKVAAAAPEMARTTHPRSAAMNRTTAESATAMRCADMRSAAMATPMTATGPGGSRRECRSR